MLCHNCDQWHLPHPCNIDLVTCPRCLNHGHLAAFCPIDPSARQYNPSHGPQATHVSQIDSELLRKIKRDICTDTLDMVGKFDYDSIITFMSAPIFPPQQKVVAPALSAGYVQSTPSEVQPSDYGQQDFQGNPLLVAAYGDSISSQAFKREVISEDFTSSFPSTSTPIPTRASAGRLLDSGFVERGSSYYQGMHEKFQRGDFVKVEDASAATPEAAPGASFDATSFDSAQDTKPDVSSDTAGQNEKAKTKKEAKATEPKKRAKATEPKKKSKGTELKKKAKATESKLKAKATESKAKVTKPKATRRALVHSPCADCKKRHKRCPKHKVKVEDSQQDENWSALPDASEEVEIETGSTERMEEQDSMEEEGNMGEGESMGEEVSMEEEASMEEQDQMDEQENMNEQDNAAMALSASHSSSVETGSPDGSNATTEPFTAEEEAALRAAIASMPAMAVYEMAGYDVAHIRGYYNDGNQFIGSDQAGMAALVSAAEMQSSNMLPPNTNAGNTDFFQPRPTDFQSHGYTDIAQAYGTQLLPSQFNFVPINSTSLQESQYLAPNTAYPPVDQQHVVPSNETTMVSNDFNVNASVEEPDAGTGFTEGDSTADAEDASMED